MHRLACTLVLLCFLLPVAALAERANRDKPVNIEADRVTVDDVNKVHVFDGRVSLAQGTLLIRGDRIVVKQDLEGFQNCVVTGSPARFRVKRDGKDEFVDAEAERIEYDARTEFSVFHNRAVIRSGDDEMRGQVVRYDGRAERIVVSGDPSGAVLPGREGRVRAVIQPKNKDAATPPVPDAAPVRLRIAPGIATPRQE